MAAAVKVAAVFFDNSIVLKYVGLTIIKPLLLFLSLKIN